VTNERAPVSFSTAAVARQLGVSAPTVQRWVDLGYLRAWKTVGGHRRIDARSVEQFLAGQRPGPQPAAGAVSVLLADDNPDDRDLLTALIDLALPGATVQTVENGFQALLAIGRAAPDLLVTDIVMPYMNGVEMLRELASSPTPGPRAVVVVTSLEPEQLARLGELPAGVGIVHKPVEPAAFAAALGALRINEKIA
jgi:excisionase family DNA binding protein